MYYRAWGGNKGGEAEGASLSCWRPRGAIIRIRPRWNGWHRVNEPITDCSGSGLRKLLSWRKQRQELEEEGAAIILPDFLSEVIRIDRR